MKICTLIVVSAVIVVFSDFACASQADDTTIRITGQAAGATPFISKVSLAVSNTSVLKSIQFTVIPKPGSVTRPLSGTYANSYLVDRGFENQQTGEITLPVYGLYDGYNNTVTLTYRFMDGSSKQANTRIPTTTFNDPCGYKNPTILQRRTNSTDLSYDYLMVKGGCSDFAPGIIDTDGALRWVGTAGISAGSAIFFDNAAYLGWGRKLVRIDLDGTVTELADYSNLGIINFHHNIDRGKVGIILDAIPQHTTTR
jgi:Arylsulfotransferase (ASST).